MYTLHFELESFARLPLARRLELLTHLLEALCVADCEYLRAYPNTPALYDSGIEYVVDSPTWDAWRDIPRTLAVRRDDCAGLSSWRVAELRVREGEPDAGFQVTAYESPHACSLNPWAPCRIDYHVQVQRADGRIEDPSRALGMQVPAPTR